MSPTKKHRAAHDTSILFSTTPFGSKNSREHNQRRAMIVRRHRAWVEAELAKLAAEVEQ